MSEKETIVFGIPVPSDDRLFLTLVVIHIFLGIISVVAGALAMLSQKAKGRHPFFGKIYYWSLLLVFATVIPLSILRWPLNNHLLVLGILSFSMVYFGRRFAQQAKPGWPRLHTITMGSSYIFLLTAFYVDNGRNLPFWRLFPQWFFWIFPALIGIPIIVVALRRHPLNKIK